MKIIFTIAWRNIWRNPVRSLVIIISLTIGLWAGTFVNALYWGMSEDRVRIAIEDEVSHIQIHQAKFKEDYDPSFFISMDSGLDKKISGINHLKAYSPRSISQAMLSMAGGSSGVVVKGVEAHMEDSVTHLASKIIEGSYFKEDKRNQILIGQKLAKKLKLKVKSKVVVSFLDTAENIVSGAFRVSGIYQSGNTSLDAVNVYVKRSEMNSMLGLNNEAHEIAILLESNLFTDTAHAKLQKELPELLVETWRTISPETDLIISTMSQFSMIFIVIILMALSFGIINTMLMAILERTREIGMVIALGMNRTKIFLMIMLETFMLSMIGCPIGLFVAWLSIQYFSKQGIDISSFSSKAMSSFGFSTMMYPSLPFGIYMEIVIIVTAGAVISSLIPAFKALKINPAETIKR